MPESKRELASLVLEDLDAAYKLVQKGRDNIRTIFDLTRTSYDPRLLPEEKRKEKEIKAYVDAEAALDDAIQRIIKAMEILSFGFRND